jgi:hypothetical protein
MKRKRKKRECYPAHSKSQKMLVTEKKNTIKHDASNRKGEYNKACVIYHLVLVMGELDD